MTRTPNEELMALTPGTAVSVIDREQVVYETRIKSIGKRIITETEYGARDQWHPDGYAYGKSIYNHRRIVTRDPESKQS